MALTIIRNSFGVPAWNGQAYEATDEGRRVTYLIDGDCYSERLARLRKKYEAQGMDYDSAYEKAESDLLSPGAWGTKMQGVSVKSRG